MGNCHKYVTFKTCSKLILENTLNIFDTVLYRFYFSTFKTYLENTLNIFDTLLQYLS